MKPLRTLFALLGFALVAGCGMFSPAPKPALQVSTEIKSLMWVGNSFFYYNNCMHGHVGQLLRGQPGVKGIAPPR